MYCVKNTLTTFISIQLFYITIFMTFKCFFSYLFLFIYIYIYQYIGNSDINLYSMDENCLY